MRQVWLVFLLVAVGAPSGAAQQRAVTLEEAIRMAQAVQPQTIQARGDVRSAGAQVRAAKGAFLPNLNASTTGATNYSENARLDPNTNQLVSGNSRNTSVNLGVSSSVDLFTGFRRGADLRAARATQDAAGAGLIDAQYQVALSTTEEFFNVLAADELLRVRAASVARAQEQLKVAVAKLRTGSATRSDSLRSLVTLGNTRLDSLGAETQLATAEANLGRLIGVAGRVAGLDDSAYYRVAEGVDTAALREEALSRSPQVQVAEARAAAARASLSAARAAYWPTLSLSGSSSWNGSKSQDYQLFNQRQLSLGMSWAIFNRFTRERTIATQDANAELATAQAADTRRQVEAALTARLAELTAATARIGITRTSVEAAREDIRVVGERYRLGAATIVDVLTSEDALNQAEVDAVNARYDYLRARAQIEALIGRPL